MIVRAGVFFLRRQNRVGLVSRGRCSAGAYLRLPDLGPKACIRFFRGDLNDGDVILACDPFFLAGTHIGDYTHHPARLLQ